MGMIVSKSMIEVKNTFYYPKTTAESAIKMAHDNNFLFKNLEKNIQIFKNYYVEVINESYMMTSYCCEKAGRLILS